MNRILLSGALVLMLGGSVFAQSSFVVGKATASGSNAFASVSASTSSSSSSSGGGSSSFTFKGVSSGGGIVAYKGSPPPTAQAQYCVGFCVLSH